LHRKGFGRRVDGVRVRDMFLSLFPSHHLPAHMYRDLRVRRVDPL